MEFDNKSLEQTLSNMSVKELGEISKELDEALEKAKFTPNADIHSQYMEWGWFDSYQRFRYYNDKKA